MRWWYALIGLFLVVAVFAIIYSFMGRSTTTTSKDLSQVIADAKAGNVNRIEVRGNRLKIELDDGTTYRSRKEEGSSIVETLQGEGIAISEPDGIEVSVKHRSSFGNWAGMLISFLPLLLIAIGGLVFVVLNRPGARKGTA